MIVDSSAEPTEDSLSEEHVEHAATISEEPKRLKERRISDVIRKEKELIAAREINSLLAWTNTHLISRGFEAKYLEDFSDGVLLINLLQSCFDETFSNSYNSRPKLQFHKLDNVTQVFDFLEKVEVSTLSLSMHDIVSGHHNQIIILLWNVLRNITIRGLQRLQARISGNPSSPRTSKGSSVRRQLLDWTNDVLKHSGRHDNDVEDMWTSFRDGVVFSAIVNDLVPGSIDMENIDPSNAKDNLAQAFEVAEKELGIPSLLSVKDFFDESADKDDKAVENYLCMLISAQKANLKRSEEMNLLQSQVSKIEQEKAKELEDLQKKIDEDKEQFEHLKDDVASLEAKYASKLEKENTLQEQIENLVNERDALSAKLQELVGDLEKSHNLIACALEKEKKMATDISSLSEDVVNRDARLKEINDQNVKLNAELYRAHREYDDVLNSFREKMKDKVVSARNAQMSSEDHMNSLIEQSIIEQKGFDDFMNTLRPRRGYFMKSRPLISIMGNAKKDYGKRKKRWFEMKGDTLYWFKKKGDSNPVGSLNLKNCQKINIGNLSQERLDEFTDEKRKQELLQNMKQMFIEISPLTNKRNIRPMRLHMVQSLSSQYQVDVYAWAEDINNRISMISYLQSMYEKAKGTGRLIGCREIVAFISDNSQTLLNIENKVPTDFHPALVHFKESLKIRRDLSITLTNTMLSDSIVDIIADIMKYNDTMKSVNLSGNVLTVKAAETIAEALLRNHSLERLDFSFNQIGDDGAASLAKSIEQHPNLERLGLSACGISDTGAIAVVEAIEKSQETFHKEHEFPIIEFERNVIGDEGVRAICRLVRKNSSIKSLRLGDNIITDNGAAEIADALISGCSVEEIFLQGNHISSKGASSLAFALSKVDRAISLDLSKNSLIGRQGFYAFFEKECALKMQLFKLTIQSSKKADEEVNEVKVASFEKANQVLESKEEDESEPVDIDAALGDPISYDEESSDEE